MTQWSGKSKGNLLGYKIFVFTIRKVGLRFSYFVLLFVALYYFLFSWKTSRSIFKYFRERHRFSLLYSIYSVYKSYNIFGQTLLDRVAISSGLKGKYTYEFDGVDLIKDTLKQEKGGVLISAHIGNFEISEYLFDQFEKDMQINVVTTDLERAVIKEYLRKFSIKSRARYILIKDDMSHIFEFHRALSDNEFICITGDRYFEGGKHFSSEFLGKAANFPAGPFIVGSKLRSPVLFVYVMKERNFRYHLYAREAKVDPKNPQVLLESYIESISAMVNRYPHQWFNYFDFWKADSKD